MKLMIYLSYINCSIVLFSLISVNFIPEKKYFEEKHFKDILKIKCINLTDIEYDYKVIYDPDIIKNYASIMSRIVYEIHSSKAINVIISVFSSIHLSLAFCSFFKDFVNLSYKTNIIYNSVLLLFSILIFILALTILTKINKITKKYDSENIGLISEIKKKIIIVIIMMSISIVIISLNYLILRQKIEYIKTINEEVDIHDLKDDNNKYKDDNNKLKDDNNKLKDDNKKLKDENQNLKELLSKKDGKDGIDKKKEREEINKLQEEINKKNNELIEIIKLKQEENGEQIGIIFISADQNINYPMICKRTEKFATYEQNLYDHFPQYKETENYFLCNGNKVNRNYTLEKNNIKFGSIIELHIIE